MNHTAKCQLLVYMDDDPESLHADELADYIWLVEQQLQEVRQHLTNREPVRPLQPFTRP